MAKVLRYLVIGITATAAVLTFLGLVPPMSPETATLTIYTLIIFMTVKR